MGIINEALGGRSPGVSIVDEAYATKGNIIDEALRPSRSQTSFGTGGVGEALMEPQEIPGPVKELASVVKAGLSGGARAASELALFPVRAAGEIAAVAAERPAAFEDVETPLTTTRLRKSGSGSRSREVLTRAKPSCSESLRRQRWWKRACPSCSSLSL